MDHSKHPKPPLFPSRLIAPFYNWWYTLLRTVTFRHVGLHSINVNAMDTFITVQSARPITTKSAQSALPLRPDLSTKSAECCPSSIRTHRATAEIRHTRQSHTCLSLAHSSTQCTDAQDVQVSKIYSRSLRLPLMVLSGLGAVWGIAMGVNSLRDLTSDGGKLALNLYSQSSHLVSVVR